MAPALSDNHSAGVVLEGQRMAGFVVIPTDVDAAMVNIGALQNVPLAGAAALQDSFGADVANVATAHGFIAGFSAARHSSGIRVAKSLLNVVMRFPDPPSAAAAATEMGAADPMAGWTLDTPPPPHHRLPIPRYPSGAVMVDDTTGNGEDAPGRLASMPTCGPPAFTIVQPDGRPWGSEASSTGTTAAEHHRGPSEQLRSGR